MPERTPNPKPIRTAALEHNLQRCYACGKCTSLCPLGRLNTTFSPRRIVTRLVESERADLLEERELWRCLGCRACAEYCPSSVEFPGFVLQARKEMQRRGSAAPCSHGGALQTWMRWMSRPESKQNRLGWIGPHLRTAKKGDFLYFVGCLPYFDAFFPDLGVRSLAIAEHTVRILNALGIEPVVLADERCCGHDLLWQGDEEAFQELARLNLEQIRDSGAKTVLMSCSECVRTFRLDYTSLLGKLPFEVTHLAEFLAAQIELGRLDFEPSPQTVTYQDPCRLGRHLGVYEEPRRVISAIPGVELKEMPANRGNAVCCGTSCWTACDRDSRRVQQKRLQSAGSAGADVLITACPKCAIHFACSRYEGGSVQERRPVIRDLAVFVSEALNAEEGPLSDSSEAAAAAGSGVK